VDINKILGKLRASGVKVTLASQAKPKLVSIPSGSLYLDVVLGTKGYPCGKLIEIFGVPSCGKSLLALKAEAYVSCQKKYTIHCDLEGNHSHEELQLWRYRFGGDMNYVIDIAPQSAEDMINVARKLLRDLGPECRLMIVDSVGAMTSTSAMDKKAGDTYIPDNPRMVNQFCRVLNNENEHVCVMMLNHVQIKMGSHKLQSKGGYGLRHFAALRLEVDGRALPNVDNAYGFANQHELSVHVAKNKLSSPGSHAQGLLFDMNLGGFDSVEDLLKLAVLRNILTIRPGGRYSLAENITSARLNARGRDELRSEVSQDPELIKTLQRAILGQSIEDFYGGTSVL